MYKDPVAPLGLLNLRPKTSKALEKRPCIAIVESLKPVTTVDLS